ncbi:MAG: hypothetical protein GX786_00790, partial [Clostridiales bacterium]|nr:hypothetical protein [Clostridiales bacterium]
MTIRCMCLDLHVSYLYLKNKTTIALLLINIVFMISSKAPGLVGFSLMLFAVLNISNLFSLGEQSHENLMLSTLPIRRVDVIKGRYGFTLAFLLVSGVLAMGLSLLCGVVFFRYTTKELLKGILV